MGPRRDTFFWDMYAPFYCTKLLRKKEPVKWHPVLCETKKGNWKLLCHLCKMPPKRLLMPLPVLSFFFLLSSLPACPGLKRGAALPEREFCSSPWRLLKSFCLWHRGKSYFLCHYADRSSTPHACTKMQFLYFFQSAKSYRHGPIVFGVHVVDICSAFLSIGHHCGFCMLAKTM